MAILRVAPIALRVLEAGEDGGDGDAEWLLDFQAGNATGFTTLTRTFFAEVVEDGSVFDESNRGDFFIAPERFLPLVDTGPENILRLRVSGFELDDNPDDILPSTEVLIPLLGPVPFPPLAST